MSVIFSRTLVSAFTTLLLLCSIIFTQTAWAEVDSITFTLDNDIFVGTDNGYTNGLYLSWYDSPRNKKPEPGYLSRLMLWSLPDNPGGLVHEVNASTLGQTMMTPSDISVRNPPEGDMPYAGLLFFNNTYLRSNLNYADKISVTVGVVGELSLAEKSQKAIHGAFGADDPKGWDTQLDNEIVFRFGRARVWRSWVSGSGKSDIVTGVDATLGTLQSTTGASILYRFGDDLQRSYATTLLVGERTSNLITFEESWFWYTGVRVGYLANWIFLDGNTFEDSRSVDDYKKEQVSLAIGLAYSRDNVSFTFSINDLNVLAGDDGNNTNELTQFGTFTIAWHSD